MKQIVECAEKQYASDEFDEQELIGNIDDRTGRILNSDEVRKARQKEVDTLVTMNTMIKVPRSVAVARGCNVIKTRWLDTNKAADGQAPDVRSR